MSVTDYLNAIKERLLEDALIAQFHIRRTRTTLTDGHIRARLELIDGSMLEFSEYFRLTSDGNIEVLTYSYHWADENENLIRRWDNTPHYPELSGFPHHIHDGVSGTVLPGEPLSIFQVLDDIAKRLT